MKRIRFNRGSVADAVRAGIEFAKAQGKTVYVFATGFGMKVETRKPSFVQYYEISSDGKYQFHAI